MTSTETSAADQKPRSSPKALVAPALVSLGCGGLVLSASILSPSIPTPNPVLGYVLAFAAVTAMTIAAALSAPVLGSRLLLSAVLLPVAILVGLVLFGEGLAPPLQALLVTTSLLLVGASVGGSVGGRIEHPGHLLAVVVVSLLVDTFSVFHEAGPTAAIMERPALIAVLALPWPIPGTTTIAPVLGFGDVVFAALYLGAARKFDLGLLRIGAAVALGLLATMVGVLVTSLPLPALVGMGLAVIVAHPKARRLPRRDWKVVILALAAMAALWAFLFLRR